MISKKNLPIYFGAIFIIGIFIWYFIFGGKANMTDIFLTNQSSTFIDAFLLIAGMVILMKVGSMLIGLWIQKAKGTPGETVMLQNVFKFAIGIGIVLVILVSWVSIGTLGSFFVAFGGMFLGWSLQSPISGIAAWLLISTSRPFRIGDRVQFPTYSLVGDIISISPLYTTLNQVGGSVGSEEPANRTVLIPNAMLFNTLVINYTPKEQGQLMKQSAEKKAKIASSQTAFMLDEFVLRITFDSDWDEAEKILLTAAREVTEDIILKTGQQPYIRADAGDWYGIYMRLRFSTNAVERPRIIYEISKRVYKAVQNNPKVDLAIPYIYSFKRAIPINAMSEQLPISADQMAYMSDPFISNKIPGEIKMNLHPQFNQK